MNIYALFRPLIVGCALALATQVNATPVLLVNNGILTGATGVMVEGKSYDVTFKDGSCLSTFNGCIQSAFTFSTVTSAAAAAQALLDQVFIDNPAIGLFDTNTDKSTGCTDPFACFTFVPYGVNSPANITLIAIAANSALESQDSVITGVGSIAADMTQNPIGNFAVFQLAEATAADVPEPSSIALLCLGLAGLAIKRRKT